MLDDHSAPWPRCSHRYEDAGGSADLPVIRMLCNAGAVDQGNYAPVWRTGLHARPHTAWIFETSPLAASGSSWSMRVTL